MPDPGPWAKGADAWFADDGALLGGGTDRGTAGRPERITDERSRTNRNLGTIRPGAVGKSSPQFFPKESKKANPEIDLSACSEWRAQTDEPGHWTETVLVS